MRVESNLAETKYLQELVKESKSEVKEAKKKSVFLTTFKYVNRRGVEVTTQDIDSLLNSVYKFSFERKEVQEDKKK